MTEMVERVAAAIMETHKVYAHLKGAEFTRVRLQFMPEARAAIEAMRDETMGMGVAGIGAMRGPHTVRDIWNAMLTAALNPKG